MRIVIDTNVVVSRFLSPKGTPAQIFEKWRVEAFELLVSEPVLSEYQKVLSYKHVRACHKMTNGEIAEIIRDFRKFAILVNSGEKLEVIKEDPDDNKFLEVAEAGGAEYIVSGDEHLLKLREYRSIQILSPAAFLAALS
ncbi:MAG: putative toxin-antitoxin system toxin component, PIN family [Peptococcaceae bacterium]